jgi:hemolysin activation/secretion protein
MGKPFRWAPDQRYSRPDWDFVAKGFIDAARVTYSQRESFEEDETLVGVGVGIDLVYKRNFTVRVDYGIPLIDAGPNEAGNGRFNFVGTILY